MPINPEDNPSEFSKREIPLFREGKCCWLIAYDLGCSWWKYCEKPSKPGADFGYCAAHDAIYHESGYAFTITKED
jgi:hypothetical protein